VTGTLPAGSYEFPVAIQDRSFNLDLAADEAPLFYPDSRKFFDGFSGPYIPGSDISPIWNPEIFGNTLVTNGRTWPKCTVERKRYRIRLLNGCNARTLILKLTTDRDAVRPVAADANVLFWVIGTEGGFLPDSAIQEDGLLMMPAERFEIILDFSKAPGDVNTYYLINEGPDEPFGGGVPDKDFPSANSATTGVVMRFDLVDAVGADTSADPAVPGALVLPPVSSLPAPAVTRLLSLNEADSHILHDVGPSEATLGMVMFDPNNEMPMGMGMEWMHAVTERVTLGDTEVWELYNFTMDAHPIHVHEVLFQVINREVFDPMMPGHGIPRPPEAWEVGFKDTVISYPGEITRIKARFDLPGRYVWHCHIVEHEDNEMMRPYDVVYRNYMPTIGA
jgi:bilirubin oxidase